MTPSIWPKLSKGESNIPRRKHQDKPRSTHPRPEVASVSSYVNALREQATTLGRVWCRRPASSKPWGKQNLPDVLAASLIPSFRHWQIDGLPEVGPRMQRGENFPCQTIHTSACLQQMEVRRRKAEEKTAHSMKSLRDTLAIFICTGPAIHPELPGRGCSILCASLLSLQARCVNEPWQPLQKGEEGLQRGGPWC